MPKSEWLAPNDTVRVSEEDIRESVAGNQYNCAITCAIQRKYPRAKLVRVNRNTISFSIGEERFRYPTPQSAVESIIEPLDTGGTPEPGLVRLTGGLVRPVKHEDPEHIERERRRRREELQGRIDRYNENVASRSDYGRFTRRESETDA